MRFLHCGTLPTLALTPSPRKIKGEDVSTALFSYLPPCCAVATRPRVLCSTPSCAHPLPTRVLLLLADVSNPATLTTRELTRQEIQTLQQTAQRKSITVSVLAVD